MGVLLLLLLQVILPRAVLVAFLLAVVESVNIVENLVVAPAPVVVQMLLCYKPLEDRILPWPVIAQVFPS